MESARVLSSSFFFSISPSSKGMVERWSDLTTVQGAPLRSPGKLPLAEKLIINSINVSQRRGMGMLVSSPRGPSARGTVRIIA